MIIIKIENVSPEASGVKWVGYNKEETIEEVSSMSKLEIADFIRPILETQIVGADVKISIVDVRLMSHQYSIKLTVSSRSTIISEDLMSAYQDRVDIFTLKWGVLVEDEESRTSC
jgi:hypothetical protein